MLSVSPITAGRGWEYLQREVARGRDDYYMAAVQAGEAQGFWLGEGLSTMGLEPGSVVSERQMENLYGLGLHPNDETSLGSFSRHMRSVEERLMDAQERHSHASQREWFKIEHDILAAGGDDSELDRAARAHLERADRAFEAEALKIRAAGERRCVAALDLTFSVPKSVSVLWAAAPNEELRQKIWDCHHEGVRAGIRFMEQHAVHVRRGFGGIRTEPVKGVVAAAFDHRMSRAGDPQMHTHVAVANKAQAPDGKWLTLNGRAIFQASGAAAAVDALHRNSALAREFGVRFEIDPRTGCREVANVPKELRALFSTRRASINATTRPLVEAYRERYGHDPSRAQLAHLSQWACLRTRQRKGAKETTQAALRRWEEAVQTETREKLADVWTLATGCGTRRVTQSDEQVMDMALKRLEESRSSWTWAHVVQAVANSMLPDAYASAEELDERWQRIVEKVISDPNVTCLTPSLGLALPAQLVVDGQSAYEPYDQRRFATRTVMAEERFVEALRNDQSVSPVPTQLIDEAIEAASLSEDGELAVRGILSSSARLDLLVGPAGAGKTSAMRAVVDAWKASGRDVIGLTLSQSAAEELSGASGSRAENTAKMLFETRRVDPLIAPEHARSWGIKAGQLVILDEASMVDRSTVASIARLVEQGGAKLLLVGDPSQLAAPDGPGIMKRLVETGPSWNLSTVHRFANAWEKDATLRLRAGDASVLDLYERHGRIVGGTREANDENALSHAAADFLSGKSVYLVATSNERAARLSAGMRERLIAAGRVQADGLMLRDGNIAGRGDWIAARQNRRDLKTTNGDWVANRSTYQVLDVTADGGFIAAALDAASGKVESTNTVVLPGEYVHTQVELAYAGTVHMAQGGTRDVSYALVAPGDSSGGLYVAATRGRDANYMFVDCELDGEAQNGASANAPIAVLTAILERVDPIDEQSALAVAELEPERVYGLANVMAIFQDVHASAREESIVDSITRAHGPEVATLIRNSDGWRALTIRLDELDHAGGNGLAELNAVIGRRDLSDADDPGQVLHWRLSNALEYVSETQRPRGYVPFSMREYPTTQYTPALNQLGALIDERIQELGERAAQNPGDWSSTLGPVPDEGIERLMWIERAGLIAGYKEAFHVDDTEGIGAPPPESRVIAHDWYETAARAITGSDPVEQLSDEELARSIHEATRIEAQAPAKVTNLAILARLARESETTANEARERYFASVREHGEDTPETIEAEKVALSATRDADNAQSAYELACGQDRVREHWEQQTALVRFVGQQARQERLLRQARFDVLEHESLSTSELLLVHANVRSQIAHLKARLESAQAGYTELSPDQQIATSEHLSELEAYSTEMKAMMKARPDYTQAFRAYKQERAAKAESQWVRTSESLSPPTREISGPGFKRER